MNTKEAQKFADEVLADLRSKTSWKPCDELVLSIYGKIDVIKEALEPEYTEVLGENKEYPLKPVDIEHQLSKIDREIGKIVTVMASIRGIESPSV